MQGNEATTPRADEAARKRVAVEMLAKHERALRRTARRYSICADDADDAFQRALEILLRKAPAGEARELVRWMQTVTKHEALAVRRTRERQLGAPPPRSGGDEEPGDWLALIPSPSAGPAERYERHEAIARSREALQTLKPAELKALTLLAEGYSYAEIGDLTGYSQTKVNRCLAEGRERFRAFLTRSDDGGRCEELRPILSAYCDGEAREEDVRALREHLRACAYCRAAMRAYRAAPGAVAALAPIPIAARPLLERAQEAFVGLQTRLPGGAGAGDSAASQVTAAGGARGIGTAALAKVLAICVGTAGGAAACVTAGIVPPPIIETPVHAKAARIVEQVKTAPEDAGVAESEAPPPEPIEPPPAEQPKVAPQAATPEPVPELAPATEAIANEPAPVAEPAPTPTESEEASAAGEFGP